MWKLQLVVEHQSITIELLAQALHTEGFVCVIVMTIVAWCTIWETPTPYKLGSRLAPNITLVVTISTVRNAFNRAETVIPSCFLVHSIAPGTIFVAKCAAIILCSLQIFRIIVGGSCPLGASLTFISCGFGTIIFLPVWCGLASGFLWINCITTIRDVTIIPSFVIVRGVTPWPRRRRIRDPTVVSVGIVSTGFIAVRVHTSICPLCTVQAPHSFACLPLVVSRQTINTASLGVPIRLLESNSTPFAI